MRHWMATAPHSSDTNKRVVEGLPNEEWEKAAIILNSCSKEKTKGDAAQFFSGDTRVTRRPKRSDTERIDQQLNRYRTKKGKTREKI